MGVRWAVTAVLVMSVCRFAFAADLGTYAFPQKGQTQEQQKKDESSCAQWAQDKTGLDPSVLQHQQEQAMASQQQAAEVANNPRVARKLGRAALTGAALGGINDNMDDGAGQGAVMGLTLGASQTMAQNKEKKVQAEANAANAQVQKAQAETQNYVRAYCACMEGKGYSIR
jgi:hypothetical protein